MIKYNNSNINDWDYGTSNIIKVYRNNAVCYYKLDYTESSGQTPCFAVVADISQYADREFEDVFNQADEKWYKLNNLVEYEEYGIYGSGRSITYYDGKLTIDGGYEYQYSGGSWVNVGEVSGSTATLPNVPFTVNFNAKNYNSQTKTLLKTSGQLAGVDAVITAGTPTVGNGYLTIASGTRATISGYQTYFNRSSSTPNLTIISKQRTDGNNCHMFANRDSIHNWMYRCYSNKLTLHGSSEQGSIAVTTQPVIESVRVNSSSQATYNNYTNNTSSTYSNFKYGTTNSGKFALFAGYASSSGEWFVGDFYWVYMSQNTLTDEQVQQVIAYNEDGGGVEYPLYYDELQDPPNNVTFTSMVEAESYECPWVGMHATINGDNYIFSGDSQSGYEWVYQPSRLPSGYTEVEYIENTSTAYINTGVYLYDTTTTSYNIQCKCYFQPYGNDFEYLFGTEGTSSPYVGVIFRYYQRNIYYSSSPDNVSWTHIDNGDGTSGVTASCASTTATNGNNPLTLFCGLWSTGPWRNGRGKIYSFKVTKNNTLVRDLVPAKRDSDDKYGMYDLITDTFYVSPNNVDFSGGEPV